MITNVVHNKDHKEVGNIHEIKLTSVFPDDNGAVLKFSDHAFKKVAILPGKIMFY